MQKIKVLFLDNSEELMIDQNRTFGRILKNLKEKPELFVNNPSDLWPKDYEVRCIGNGGDADVPVKVLLGDENYEIEIGYCIRSLRRQPDNRYLNQVSDNIDLLEEKKGYDKLLVVVDLCLSGSDDDLGNRQALTKPSGVRLAEKLRSKYSRNSTIDIILVTGHSDYKLSTYPTWYLSTRAAVDAKMNNAILADSVSRIPTKKMKTVQGEKIYNLLSYLNSADYTNTQYLGEILFKAMTISLKEK